MKKVFCIDSHTYLYGNMKMVTGEEIPAACIKIESEEQLTGVYDKVPSTSQIISAAEQDGEKLIDLSFIKPELLERAQQVGTAVHACIEYDLAGKLNYNSISFDILEYFHAYKTFMKDRDIKILGYEIPDITECDGLRFGNTIDAKAVVGGKKIIIDWKTGTSIHETNKIQQGGYMIAHPDVDESWLVQLRKDGTYGITIVEKETYVNVFKELIKKYLDPEYYLDIKHIKSGSAKIDADLERQYIEAVDALEKAKKQVDDLKEVIVFNVGAEKAKGERLTIYKTKNSTELNEDYIKTTYPDIHKKCVRQKITGIIDIDAIAKYIPSDIVNEIFDVQDYSVFFDVEAAEELLKENKDKKLYRIARRGSFTFKVAGEKQ